MFVSNRPQSSPESLADVLERVLDKGIVIVGDIQVRLLDIELLTIKVRLMVASVDKAREMGINWWEGDPFVSNIESEEKNEEELDLRRRLEALESRVGEQNEIVEGETTRERR
nr:gas vesicle protein [Nocardioides luteus]